MPNWLHRTSKRHIKSVASADLAEPVANYIEEPDLSAVAGQPVKYWIITGDVVSLADAAARAAIDQAEIDAERDQIANEMDDLEDMSRAFALAVLDQFNAVSTQLNAVMDAIENGNNLSAVKSAVATIPRVPDNATIAQMKAVVRSKLGS